MCEKSSCMGVRITANSHRKKMSSSQERGYGKRLRIKMMSKELFIDSRKLTLKMDPFWILINPLDCPTMSHVKKIILMKLTMLIRRLKFFSCDEDSKSDQIIDSETLNKTIVFHSCKLLLDDCFLPSQESSNLVRDGDLISVHVKFKIQDKISSDISEGHVKCSGYTSRPSKTEVIACNISDINTTGDDLLQPKKKIKNSENKNISEKCSNEQNTTSFCLEKRNDSNIIDFEEVNHETLDLITQENINPHHLSASKASELKISKLENASSKRLNIVENKNSLKNGSFFNDDNNSKSEEDKIIKEAHYTKDKKIISYSALSQTNTFNRDKNMLHCFDRSVKRQKYKDTDSRSLSALVRNLQMQFSEDVTDEPKTKSLEDTLDASGTSKFKQETGLSKRKRVRKRKKCQKKSINLEENSKPVEILHTRSLSDNLKNQNQHITFDENDTGEESNGKTIAYKEQQSLSVDSQKSENIPAKEEKHIELEVPNEMSSFSEHCGRDSIKFKIFEKKQSADSSLNDNVKNKQIHNSDSSKLTLRYNAETFNMLDNAIHGSPIDPFNKFHQLLTQRNFSGRQVEIIHSGDGHHIYNFCRKKKKDFSTNLTDSSSDFVYNVSSVALSTDDKLLQKPDTASKNVSLIDNNSQTSEMENNFKSTDYKNLDFLHQTPKAGDIIAFKVIELSDNYSPALSNFKEAKVISVNKDLGSVHLELTKAVKKRTQGKFDLDYSCYDEDSSCIETYNISELIEVKLVQAVENNLLDNMEFSYL